MKYNVNYFIKKFEAIPENKWITGSFGNNDKHCVNGHCGVRTFNKVTEESKKLNILINKFFPEIKGNDSVMWATIPINDSDPNSAHLGDHPKERILNALYNIKGMEG